MEIYKDMKLIDKDKIVAEIERRLKGLKDCHAERVAGYAGEISGLERLLSFIDSLEVKEEVYLEKEFYDFLDTLTGKDNGHLSENELFRIAEYFYTLGLNAQKGE